MNQQLKKLSGKKLLILGLGREGLSTYSFLRENLPKQEIFISDEKQSGELDPQWSEILTSDNTKYLPVTKLKEHNFDFVFKTPGVPNRKLTDWQVSGKVTSNMQLFFEVFKGTTIGVTGTKGKSTTTTLTYEVLKAAGKDAYLLGNIGQAALDSLKTMNENSIAVIELSSHQLSTMTVSPHIAVIQAITPEHMDYYENFEEYANAKSRIIKYPRSDQLVIYNCDSETTTKIASNSKAKKIPFGKSASKYQIVNNAIAISNRPFLNLNETKIKGQHNLYNTLPCIIVGQEFGISDEIIKKAIIDFKGLEHRLEFVANINGVDYYNDSLATTPEATIAAIEAFQDKDLILICGGYDRSLDYSQLGAAIANAHAHRSTSVQLITLPETGKKIADLVKTHRSASRSSASQNSASRSSASRSSESQDSASQSSASQSSASQQVQLSASLSDAVQTAKNIAKPGDVVLLSPAAASFNSFRDYQERGEKFRELVNAS